MKDLRDRKISIDPNKGFTRKFILEDEDGNEMHQIEIGATTDEYNNPTLHIAPVTQDDEIFENYRRLQYSLMQFCEDAAIGYLEGGPDRVEGIYQICKSLRRTADVLEYKYKRLSE